MVIPKLPTAEDEKILKLLEASKKPVFLLVNQVDIFPKPHVLPVLETYAKKYPFAELIPYGLSYHCELFGSVVGKFAANARWAYRNSIFCRRTCSRYCLSRLRRTRSCAKIHSLRQTASPCLDHLFTHPLHPHFH